MGLLTLTGAGLSPWSISSGDPYFSSVVLLALNENGADAGTTFDDASASNHTLTAVGNAQWDTAQAPTGLTSSLLLDGTGDYLSAADHANWDFTNGDFTVELHARFNGSPPASVRRIIGHDTFPGNRAWALNWRGDLTPDLSFFYSTDGTNITDSADRDWAATGDTWYHLAACRSGANLRIFVNGAILGTAYDAGTETIASTASALAIGSVTWTGGFEFTGWIAAVRITKGVARYTGTFTPPTLPLPTS